MSGAHPDLGYMRSTRPHPLGRVELLITVELGLGSGLAWTWKLIATHRAAGQAGHVGLPPTPVLQELWLPFEPTENYEGRKQKAEGYTWVETVQTSVSSGLGVRGGDGNWTSSKRNFHLLLQPACVMPTFEAPQASSRPPTSPFNMTTTHTVCGSSQHSTLPRWGSWGAWVVSCGQGLAGDSWSTRVSNSKLGCGGFFVGKSLKLFLLNIK